MEIELFRAIMAHKPVGADRHFQMIFIKALLSSRIHTAALSTDQLWVKLDTLYNMEELVCCMLPALSQCALFSAA